MLRYFLSLFLVLGLLSFAPAAMAQTITGGQGDFGEVTGGGDPNFNDHYDDDGDAEQRPAPSQRVATTRGLRPEYVLSGPRSQTDAAVATLESLGAQLLRYRDLPGLGLRVLVFDFHNQLTVPAALEALAPVAPDVRLAQHHIYDFIFSPASGGGGTGATPRLYAQELIGDDAPGRCALSRPINIGIIDAPVDASHPALAGARVVTQSVLGAGERPPGGAHGTAVATLLVGESPESGLAGFARGGRLFSVSAFATQPGGPGADLERLGAAIDWLVRNDVRLINMSFAGPQNDVLAGFLEQAAARGAVMVAAAGNDGREYGAYPAAHPAVIAVTAVDAGSGLYRRANTGSHIEFAAPGVDLFVARETGGGYASGTSFAAPIVTALAARSGAGSAEATRTALRRSARDLGSAGQDAQFGWGLVRGGC